MQPIVAGDMQAWEGAVLCCAAHLLEYLPPGLHLLVGPAAASFALSAQHAGAV